jgi:hypothetical protein
MGTTKIRAESKPNFSNAIALSLLPYKYKFPINQNSKEPLNQCFFGWLDKARYVCVCVCVCYKIKCFFKNEIAII